MSYKKIHKPIARKMYNMGFSIYLVPCKCRFVDPDSNVKSWVTPFKILISECEEKMNKFDRTVDTYTYYNCNAELGYYPVFYVKEQDYELYKTGDLLCI